jgi:asparagine synthase (glutamine-hydrolysing)
MDEPYQSQSAFLGYHVFQEAAKNDVIVLLNGQGADEYLSGYGTYRHIRHMNLLKKFKFKRVYGEIKKPKVFIRLLLATILNHFQTLKEYIRPKNVFDIIINHNYLGTKARRSNYRNYNSHLNISKTQLFVDPLPRYLRWEDRNSMAHSIEARVPFLDYRLIEFVHTLPLEYLDAPNISKRILVEALQGILPEKVRNRKDKKGFITPEERWFMEDFSKEFQELFIDNVKYAKGLINQVNAMRHLLNIQNGIVPFDYSYWRIILFCIWMKIFNVEIE